MNGLYEKLYEEKVVVLDIETTGLRCGEDADRILEIAAVKLGKLQKTETFHRFIACSEPIPEEVVLLTGITDEMLAGAPPLAQVLKEFAAFSEGAVLAAYHLPFDCQFLDYYGAKCGISFSQDRVDLLPLVRRVLGAELKDRRGDGRGGCAQDLLGDCGSVCKMAPPICGARKREGRVNGSENE